MGSPARAKSLVEVIRKINEAMEHMDLSELEETIEVEIEDINMYEGVPDINEII